MLGRSRICGFMARARRCLLTRRVGFFCGVAGVWSDVSVVLVRNVGLWASGFAFLQSDYGESSVELDMIPDCFLFLDVFVVSFLSAENIDICNLDKML